MKVEKERREAGGRCERLADWKKVKNQYVTGHMSLEEVAEQFGISSSTIRKRAAAEKWTEERERHRNNFGTILEQKTTEKISDSESEIAAIRSRVHLKLMQEVERQTDAIMSGDINSADLRRIVQSYKDMCDIVVETVGDEKQHNALVSAIREAAERRRGHD